MRANAQTAHSAFAECLQCPHHISERAHFLTMHPGVRAEIVADEAFTDIVAAGFDAGVRYRESLDQDMIAVSLGVVQRFVVIGSPGYFAVHGRPNHPSELKAHKCFAQVFPRGNQMAWTFEKAGEEISAMPRGPLASTDATIQLQAARAGLGLAFLFEEMCIADIANRASGNGAGWLEPALSGPLSLLS
jgi:DNA-binding transcriptional LysR family regulator